VTGRGGGWLRIAVELPGRRLWLRVWRTRVGRTSLFLLDSNDLTNTPSDRGITCKLYGSGAEIRLLLERARSVRRRQNLSFADALWATRAGNVFTTHTPVAAGFDRFALELIGRYFASSSELMRELGIEAGELLALGRSDPRDRAEPFNMTYVAMRGCARVNGVSRLHVGVSRRIFAPLFPRLPAHEVPVGNITNGVHMPFVGLRSRRRALDPRVR
jgi:starch phosphorylase